MTDESIIIGGGLITLALSIWFVLFTLIVASYIIRACQWLRYISELLVQIRDMQATDLSADCYKCGRAHNYKSYQRGDTRKCECGARMTLP